MTDGRTPLDHASHDRLLIAAHVAGDTTPDQASHAVALLADCAECRQLAADLAGIAAASRALPPPRRARDFQLSPEQAARIRRWSIRDRVAAFLLGPRGVGRALAPALMTLGLVALVISAFPGLPGGAATAMRDASEPGGLRPAAAPPFSASGGTGAGAAAPEQAKSSAAATAAPAPNVAPAAGAGEGDAAITSQPGRAATAAPTAPDQAEVAGPASTPAPSEPLAATGQPPADAATTSPGPPPLLFVAIALLGAGILLLAARRLAPRFGI